MRSENESDQESSERTVTDVSRRRLLTAGSTLVGLGLAGCSSNDDGAATPGQDGGTPTQSGGTLTDTPTQSTPSDDLDPEDLRDATFNRGIGTVPTNISLNGYNPNSSAIISNSLFEHTFFGYFDGSYEMGAVTDVAYDQGTKTIRMEFSDEYTYHNGDPLTAENFWVSRALLHNVNPETSTWAEEPTLVDDYTFEGTLKNASSRLLLMGRFSQALSSPPDVFKPILEDLRAASSQKERDQIYNDQLTGLKFGLDAALENGYGNGPYKLANFDEQKIVLEKYEDHPRADEISIPKWKFKFYGGQSSTEQAIKSGEIDYGSDLKEALQNATPRDVQTLDRTGVPFGFHLGFNFTNKHLGRRNVRRAIVSAIPIPSLIDNFGDGVENQVQTSMPNALNKKYLGDMTEDLIQYPLEADTKRAAEYMERAGYSKNGSGMWVGPDGDTVELDFPTINGWSLMAKTTQETLDSFGMDVSTTIAGWNTTMSKVREEYDYDLTLFRHGCWQQLPHPACFYRHDKHINLNIGTDEDINQALENGETVSPNTGKPIKPTIPTEVGAEEVSGDGTQLNMMELADNIETASGDELAELAKVGARYFNYDLPVAVLFEGVQRPWGDTAAFNFPSKGSKAYKTKSPVRRALKTGKIDAVPKE